MMIALRSDNSPDVQISRDGVSWETCGLALLEQHIRAMLTARRWLKREKDLKAVPK